MARSAAVVGACLALANCASSGKFAGRVDPRYGVSSSPRVVAYGEAVPKGGGTYRVGKPYMVAGRMYVPEEDVNYREDGLASWYGDDFHGRLTANGEVFDMDSLTAAHPTLPMPCYARVTNLSNGKSLIVRVNDRGPYHGNRLINVSNICVFRARTTSGHCPPALATSAGDARVRAPHPGGDHRREKPLAVRLRDHRRGTDQLREGARTKSHRPATRRRMDRPKHRRDSGAQPRTTPLDDPDQSRVRVKVPQGTASLFTARLASASPSELVALTWYTVKKGETIATIARKLRVSRVDLAEANHLSTKSRIAAGQALVIPRAPATLLATNSRPSAPTEVASRAISGAAPMADVAPPTRAAQPVARVVNTSAKTVTYRVKNGDTLYAIAQLFDTTVARIKSLNRLRSNRITPGTRLKIASGN